MASPYQSLAPVVSGEGGGGGGVDSVARSQIIELQADMLAAEGSINTNIADIAALDVRLDSAEAAIIATDAAVSSLDTRIDALEAAPGGGGGGGGLPTADDCLAAYVFFEDLATTMDLSLSSTYITHATSVSFMPNSFGIVRPATNSGVGETTVSVLFRKVACSLLSGNFTWVGQFAISTDLSGTTGYRYKLGLADKATYNTAYGCFIGFDIGGTALDNQGIRPLIEMNGNNYVPATFTPLTPSETHTAKITFNATTKEFAFFVDDMVTPIATFTFAAGVSMDGSILAGWFSRAPTLFGTEKAAFCYIDNMYIKQECGARA